MQNFHNYLSICKKNLKLLVATLVVATVLNVVPAGAAPAPTPAPEKNYIVVLKNNVSDSRGVASDHGKRRGAKVSNVYSHAIKGYSAKMSASAANDTAKDANVAYVTEDSLVHISTIQTRATWGLDRIDQRTRTLNTRFNYVASGAKVKAYIIDTGIRTTHTDLGGRAVSGYDSIDGALPADDCNGHGTHVAGTVGGKTYGVAKNVKLIAVRVLDCDGYGYWSQIIAGIDYVTADHKAGEPAVANMSIQGSANDAVDAAVKNSIADGVSYAIAAGNNTMDACQSSPARVTDAMTVGATDNTDTKASWSNYGNCVDWFAPGVNITSDWLTSDSATAVLSGTSMATPHTAGVTALYLQRFPRATPKQVRDAIYQLTTKNVVVGSKSVNSHLLYTNL